VSPPQTVSAKAKLLLSESMNAKSLKVENPSNWNDWEKDWMASFNLKISKHTTAQCTDQAGSFTISTT
jgi:hypothetical protein